MLIEIARDFLVIGVLAACTIGFLRWLAPADEAIRARRHKAANDQTPWDQVALIGESRFPPELHAPADKSKAGEKSSHSSERS